ncbi:helix-turn-helix transcriptional regulator [Diaphorobacter ruginosibacter]|uniref:Helix-turn-helix transcriptional regulator n=1 Tax=Diaphorobacter ruginosibacter TaxID=1715720 RepID=A0A7G9RS46_9BURK|nr:XRE family transcriptional regulator [Diaphorobacter ruginosibacter]QNN58421.1 helix-turn-helix transcriptional regulator [Diaphorobacter ruginosibacter]
MNKAIPTETPEAPDADLQFGLAVRARRAQLGITLDQLAEASGVSPGSLSRVERGLLSASLRNAMAIARGLGCDIGELLQESDGPQVTRASEHRRIVHEDTGVARIALAKPAPGLSVIQYEVPPGAESSHFAAHRAGTREMFYILKGSVRVFAGTESVLLRTGDTAVLTMDSEHRFINEGATPARLILIVSTPVS